MSINEKQIKIILFFHQLFFMKNKNSEKISYRSHIFHFIYNYIYYIL